MLPLDIPYYESTLFNSLAELETAATSPCSLCRCLRKCIESHEMIELPATISTVLVLSIKQGRGSLRVRLEDRALQPASPIMKLARTIALYAPGDCDLDKSPKLIETLERCSKLENESTGSESSFTMARHWVDECLENHPNCSKNTEGWLPDRVIDVGPEDGSIAPRLVETAGLWSSLATEERKYVALSHCWGLKPIITTKIGNLEQHKRCIPMSDLSHTFRDATITTRKLSRRFLWIDSLCIIQDSKEDWKEQSIQMCTIYQRAIFTIMAVHASSGDEGCFVTRDGLAANPFRLQFKICNGKVAAVDAWFISLSRDSSTLNFTRSLYDRAWVLQEQAISRARLIYFGDQIYWECSSAHGSERSSHGGAAVSGLTDFTRAMSTIADPFFASEVDDAKGFVESMHSQWCSLIENYMQRGITHTTDRLIAVDGLAQAIRVRTSNQYLAGLWRNQLVMGLTWYIPWTAGSSLRWEKTHKSPKWTSSRHEKPIAPSWSWASVTYPVEWPWSHAIKQRFIAMETLCEIISANVSGTPFEQRGKISLRGMTRRLWVDPCYQRLHFAGRQHKNPKIKEWDIADRDYHLEWAWTRCRVSFERPRSKEDFRWLSMEFYPDELLDRNGEVTFVALGEVPAKFEKGQNFHLSRPTIVTLALIPTGNPNEYRRVGFAEWKNCSWYGYFCVGEYRADYRESLKTGHLVGGWRRFVWELLEVSIILLFGSLFRLPIVQLHRDGLVWFRHQTTGNRLWGQHVHKGDIKSERSYRRGWEPKYEYLKII